MGRPLRIDPQDGWHHVMNRGIDHGTIFFADSDRAEFGRLLGLMYRRFGTEIHAYCLMSNHYHLLVRCPEGGISASMQLLGTRFVRHVNDRLGRDGPLFKSRFHSRLITDTAYLANVLRYVHLNPLDIAGVEHPAAYRWSSHRTYLGLRRRPDWLSIDYFLDWFGGDICALDAFVSGDDASAPVRLPSDDVSQLVDACGLVVAERSPSHPRSRHGELRCLALQLAEHLDDADRSQIHEALGLSDDALSRARHRARRLAREQPHVRSMLAAARRLVGAPPNGQRTTSDRTDGAWHHLSDRAKFRPM